MVLARLPAGVVGHFGPELRRFVLAQHHQGQVTVPRLVAQLRGIGVAISKRQVMRLLIAGQDGFLAENRDVLGRPADGGLGLGTTPARATLERTASARRSAMTISPGSPPGRARAG